MKRTTFLASLFAPLVACFAQRPESQEVSGSLAGNAVEPQKEPVTPSEAQRRAFDKALKEYFQKQIDSYLPPCPGCADPAHVRVFLRGDDWLCDRCFFAKLKDDPSSHREMVSVGWAEPVDIQDGDRLIFEAVEYRMGKPTIANGWLDSRVDSIGQ